MLLDTKTAPTRNELLLDLAAFVGTAIAAVVLSWKAADIVWASWITSLLTGLTFFFILSIKMLWDYTAESSTKKPTPMDANPGCLCVAVGAVLGLLAWLAGPGLSRLVLAALLCLDVIALAVAILAPRDWLGVSLKRPFVRAFFYFPTSLFFFFFFLAHFGGFHMGHAVFLSFFVPPEVEVTIAEESLASLRASLGVFLGALILTYWPYIVSVAIKSAGDYRTALLAASKQGDEMILPYKNVIRIHLLIFALIPLAAFGSSTVLTIGVLAFFFFPVESVVAWFKSR